MGSASRRNTGGTALEEAEEPLLLPDQQQINSDERKEPPLPSILRLVMLGQPEFLALSVAALFMCYNQITSLLLPRMIGDAYDDLMDPTISNKMASINRIMLTVVLLHFSAAIAGCFRSAIMGIAGERIVARLRSSLYASMLQQEIAFFDATQSGELVSRLGSDTTVVKQAISSSWAEVSLGLIKLIAAITLMLWISPRLAGVTMGSTMTVFVICAPLGKYMGKLSKKYQDVLGEAQNYPTEILGAMRTVQSFTAEERETERYISKIGRPNTWCPDQSTTSTFSLGYLQALLRSSFYTVIFGGGFGAMYVTLWYGFYLVHEKHITLGELTAFQSYIFQIGGILAHTSSSLSKLLEARGASQRLFALLDREPKISRKASDRDETLNDMESNDQSKQAAVFPTKLQGAIEFQKVCFSYPTRPDVIVLKDFTLSIPKGSTTAVVGPSGAGKSTLVSLIERFYDADDGIIRIDGVDIQTMDLKLLRQHIGFVQQEPTLFARSIRDNVTFGLDCLCADDEILDACRKANAYDFISKWPDGLDTLVGERGVQLSGGQKQRLAIARAILVNPCVLLLDEATSALDAESEHLVQKAIDNASEGRTVVIVAHRLSTIRKADQIVVLKDQTLQDVGTHEELMQRCPIYQNLVSRQFNQS